MERLRPWLIEIHFKVYTDCQALIYVHSLKTKNPQLIRWLGMIEDYDYEIHHRKGDQMKHIDALSRAPVEQAEKPMFPATLFSVQVHEDEILMFQHSDMLLNSKIKILEKVEHERSRRERREVLNYVLRDGILYKLDSDGKELYVVPTAMRKALVIKNHDLSSHFGVDRTIARIRNFFYFPRMSSYVRRHIASCIEYLLAKNKVGRQAGELHPIPAGKRPFEIVHLDHFGPFVTSSQKNKYILAAICNLTKFTQLYAVRDVKAGTTIRKIEQFVQRFGAPERIITDRGTSFTAGKFEEFFKVRGIKHTLNSSRHAQANGQVERLNQTLLPALQANLINGDGSSWDKDLCKLEYDLNSSISKTTGRTSYKMYGYIPRIREGLSRDLTRVSEKYIIPKDIRR